MLRELVEHFSVSASYLHMLAPAAGISTRRSSEVSAGATRERDPEAMATKATPEWH